jgi:hypothetical protein
MSSAIEMLGAWIRSSPAASPDPQLIDPLQRRTALTANQRMAIAAHQRLGDRLGASRAVELGGGLVGFCHKLIMPSWAAACNFAFQMQNCKCPAYFAAAIESTWIVFVFASSVPVTVTFLAANLSGVLWSLNA